MSHKPILPLIDEDLSVVRTADFDVPKNQLQMILYVDYTLGTETAVNIQLEFEDINIPGEFFEESAKLNFTTMEQIPLFHRLLASRKLAIPFPISYSYKTIRVTVTPDAPGNGTILVWLNPGRFVEDTLPDAMTKGRDIGELWETPT